MPIPWAKVQGISLFIREGEGRLCYTSSFWVDTPYVRTTTPGVPPATRFTDVSVAAPSSFHILTGQIGCACLPGGMTVRNAAYAARSEHCMK